MTTVQAATSTFQADFFGALTSADPDAVPTGLDTRSGRRFRVYRNNMRHALITALADAFPVVRRLVGDEAFVGTAKLFVEAHPPRDRALATFGAALADFLDGFEPARSVPYLGDIARLEWARVEASHAADAPPLDPARLAVLGERVVEARFSAHPAARLVASRYPLQAIWQANDPEHEGDRVPEIPAGADWMLITRPGYALRQVRLSAGNGRFARALLSGMTADQAADQAADEAADHAGGLTDAGQMPADRDFDAMEAFRILLDVGAFTDFQTAHTPD
jgi:hypothetical protein